MCSTTLLKVDAADDDTDATKSTAGGDIAPGKGWLVVLLMGERGEVKKSSIEQ